jgi:hypothetical protein
MYITLHRPNYYLVAIKNVQMCNVLQLELGRITTNASCIAAIRRYICVTYIGMR